MELVFKVLLESMLIYLQEQEVQQIVMEMIKLFYIMLQMLLLIFSEFLEKMEQEQLMNLKTEERKEKRLFLKGIPHGMKVNGT